MILSFILTSMIYFYGDSITKDWNDYKLISDVNFIGIKSASSTKLTNNINNIINRHPCKLFIMMGINNIDERNQILKDYKKCIDKIRSKSPNTIIYIQSILPTRTISLNKNVIYTNNKLKEYCNLNNIIFIDLYKQFIDKNGKLIANLTTDGTHLTKNGYLLWKKMISKYLNIPTI